MPLHARAKVSTKMTLWFLEIFFCLMFWCLRLACRIPYWRPTSSRCSTLLRAWSPRAEHSDFGPGEALRCKFETAKLWGVLTGWKRHEADKCTVSTLSKDLHMSVHWMTGQILIWMKVEPLDLRGFVLPILCIAQVAAIENPEWVLLQPMPWATAVSHSIHEKGRER